MKKEKFYQFVPKRNIRKYLQLCQKILDRLCEILKNKGIAANYYIVGSGKRHLVTRLVINGIEQPFDLDFNLEVDLNSLPKKLKEDLAKLKEKIRSELNKILKEFKTDFKDGKDSPSVVKALLIPEDKTKFSFDLAIISKNKDGDLQRLAHKNDNFNWEMIRNSADIENKAERLRKQATSWNELRNTYLDKKNKHYEEDSHPSITIFIDVVNKVYDKYYKNFEVNNVDIPINSKRIVDLICDKIIGLKYEKRPKRIKSLLNFVDSLEKWRKIQPLPTTTDFKLYQDPVFKQLEKNKKIIIIKNSKKLKWFDS